MIGSTASRPPFPVTLDNWQTAEQVGWTFCHIAEIFPTATISRGSERAVPLPRHITRLVDLTCRDADGESTTVGAIMKATETDGWMVVHDGELVAEQYAGAMEPDTLHLLMSVSKSIVGILVGALAGQGLLSVEEQITTYVPELEHSGYRGATVRHLLDMRSGIEFSEDYLDPTPRSECWSRRSVGHHAAHRMCRRRFVASCLHSNRISAHGGPFNTAVVRLMFWAGYVRPQQGNASPSWRAS